jgi:CheY-like chemotaxis protein
MSRSPATQTATQTATMQDPRGETEPRKTVLIVDDSLDTAMPMARMISHFGHRGMYVTSGEAALEFVERQLPDLMLLDVMMPGIDGLEVLRNLRSNPKTAHLPVVLFSAISDPAYKAHAIRKGATDYWVKASVDFDELRFRIDQLLGGTVH